MNKNIDKNNSAIVLNKEILDSYTKNRLKSLLGRFLSNKLALTGCFLVVIFVIMAIFANFLAPYDPYIINSKESFSPISKTHLLGADQFGRDILSRIMYGARISLKISVLACMIATFFGVVIGGIAGYYGGKVDNLLMRIMDALFSLPAILLAIALIAALGPGENNAIVALGVVYIPLFSRVVRSAVISNKENDYVEAAKAVGQSNFKIIFSHIIPNCSPVILVQATITLAEAIVVESGLSFIGLGPQPPAASWGKMLADAYGYMSSYPLATIFPGMAISLSVLGFNLLGDGLRDILDPKLSRAAL